MGTHVELRADQIEQLVQIAFGPFSKQEVHVHEVARLQPRQDGLHLVDRHVDQRLDDQPSLRRPTTDRVERVEREVDPPEHTAATAEYEARPRPHDLEIDTCRGAGECATYRGAAVPGRSYTIRAMNRLRSGDQQRIEIRFVNNSENYLSRGEISVLSGWSSAWRRVSKTFAVPAAARLMIIRIGDRGSDAYSSTHDWDAISLVAN